MPRKEHTGAAECSLLPEMYPSGDQSRYEDDEISPEYELMREFFSPASTDTVDSDSVPHIGSVARQTSTSREKDVNSDLNFSYKMRCPERGCFFIFNHENFDVKTRSTREGSRKDAANLKRTAKLMGFETIQVMEDLTVREIFDFVDKCLVSDLSNYACFACAFLTHGDEEDRLYARDKSYSLKELIRHFGADLCPDLAGKPKLFFIQACRGTKLDHGAPLYNNVQCDAIGGSNTGVDESTKHFIIPVEADFLIAHSTTEDYYSWRNTEDGSPYIQTLCYCLQLYGKKLELMQILTRVNRFVAFKFQSQQKMKQIPSITSRLTAEVHFSD